MRLTILIFVLGINSLLAASSYSQMTRITIKASDTRVEDVLNLIENKSEFFFLFNQKLIDLNRKVSIDAKEEKISDILDELFAGTDVTHQVIDRQIILITGEAILTSGEVTGNQQQKYISGNVTDRTGASLPGTSVVVKGTSIGTITDANGNYTLSNVPGNATLIFSFIGMKTEEVSVGNKSTISVTLAEETIGLEEVVAVGYGTQKKVNLTGSVVTIGNEKLTQRPVANVGQMLQGKLAGVEIIQNTGEPGAEGISIRIRGLNSFGTSNTPIVLVDGFEGNLSNLDPNNVESISVLKDASSAAIYGSRAANGVILVTTKRGKAGESSITYSANFAIHQASRLPELVNDPVKYMEMFNTASVNSGAGVSYPLSIIDKYKSGELKGYNWDDVFWKKAFVQNHNLTATGGTRKLRYNFGLNYWINLE